MPPGLTGLGDTALGEVTAALFYEAHDLLVIGLAEWRPRALRMLQAAQACSDRLEYRCNKGRPRH